MNQIVEISACLADAVLSIWFIIRFNRKKGFSLWITLLLGGVYGAINIASLYVSLFSPLLSVVNLLILLVYSATFRQSSWGQRVIAPFTFEGTLILVNTLVAFMTSVIFGIDLSEAVAAGSLIRFSSLFTSKIVLWLVLLMILKIFLKADTFQWRDLFMMAIMPILLFCQMGLIVNISLAYPIENMQKYLFASLILSVAFYFGTYFLVSRIIRHRQVKEENRLYKQVIENEKKRFRDMNCSIDRIRKIRHDMKNQLLAVQVRLKEKDYAGAEKILEEITEQTKNNDKTLSVDHPILDYILQTKLGTVPDAIMIVSVNTDCLNKIEDLDLSMLFGSLIDNAVEAVAKLRKPEIELSVFEKNQYVNIVCKNNVAASVLEKNPQLRTSKTDRENHGYGIRTIRQIAEKYKGIATFYEEELYFYAHVMIPKP